jgi:hypothetical protein
VLAATKLTAFLTINQEIPAPQGARGSGTFTATFSGNTIKFRLTYKGLTGAAAAAHIHVASPARPTRHRLSRSAARARTGTPESSPRQPAVMKKILGGGTYVNIHTAKNGGGEIRGQIASS